MVTQAQQVEIIVELDQTLAATQGREASVGAVMRLIAERLPHYNWVGVYLLDNGVLNLGPYVGAATEHTLIPVGQGVCGTAVATGQNQVIADVREIENYLSCSVETRSEIVVHIRDAATGRTLGQIDADGHAVGAFDETDEAFLTVVAARLAPYLWKAD